MKSIVLGLLFMIYLTGCGYTTKGFAYKEDKIQIVPIVASVEITDEDRRMSGGSDFPVLLEKKLTNAVVAKFNIEGHLRVVKDPQNALRLACVVKDYAKETLRYDEIDDVSEQRLLLKAEVKLKDSFGESLFEKEVIGEATYFLSGPRAKSETQAQEDLIDDTSRKILEAVTDEW